MIVFSIPEHVWDMILMKITKPSRLIKLREVNKSFKEKIIDKWIENTCMWKNLCKPRIESWMHTILKLKYPYRVFRMTNVLSHEDYKEYYINYQKWRRVVTIAEPKFKVDFNKFFLKDEEVTCTDVCGRFIIFGTNLGRVHFSVITEPEVLVPIHDFKDFVTAIKFWFTDNETILVVVVINKHLEFWHLNSNGKISCQEICFAEHICVGVDNRFFSENQLVITEYKYIDKRVITSKKCTISHNSSSKPNFLSMYNRFDELIVMIESNKTISVYEINFPNVYSENVELTNLISVSHNIIPDARSRIISGIPIEETGFYIADNAIISHFKYAESEREWVSYILKQKNEDDNITYVTMFANIYFICWESGAVDKVVIKKDKNNKKFVIKKFSSSLVLGKPTIAINFVEHKDQFYAIFTTKTSSYYLTK